jgi:AcrR family transcriptional regulator
MFYPLTGRMLDARRVVGVCQLYVNKSARRVRMLAVEAASARDTGLTSRSRRGPSKGDLKEQAILETAERLLVEKSVHELGVEEIAKGAEISRPSFYFYFESKYAVLQALVDRVVRRTYEAAGRWLTRDDEPPEEAVQRAIQATAEHWREHGPILRAAVQTWGAVPEMGRFWEGITAGFVEAAAGMIERERRAGRAAAGPPSAKALATALIWMNERSFYTASIGATPSVANEELVETLTTIWLRAVYGSEHPGERPEASSEPAAERASA